jgi:hypothetical protein
MKSPYTLHRSELRRLRADGYPVLLLAHMMLERKGVIDHLKLWLRHGTPDNFKNLKLPIP